MKKMALLALLNHLYVWLKATQEAENKPIGERKGQMKGIWKNIANATYGL
ncbi:hypothetical protein [Serratia fonticola]|nr:hypothetical protein [Serratia fonticola]